MRNKEYCSPSVHNIRWSSLSFAHKRKKGKVGKKKKKRTKQRFFPDSFVWVISSRLQNWDLSPTVVRSFPGFPYLQIKLSPFDLVLLELLLLLTLCMICFLSTVRYKVTIFVIDSLFVSVIEWLCLVDSSLDVKYMIVFFLFFLQNLCVRKCVCVSYDGEEIEDNLQICFSQAVQG